MSLHLAEINVARLKHPIDDPRVAPFADNVARVNGIAERSPGFEWRNVAETSGPVRGDPHVIATLSVWQSVAEFENFVWNTLHRQFYQRRAEWFEMLDSMHFAMWRVLPGSTPSLADGLARLDQLEREGPSDAAFGWADLPEATGWKAMAGSRQ
jgi:heme-degrading monooxygenase HmoA